MCVPHHNVLRLYITGSKIHFPSSLLAVVGMLVVGVTAVLVLAVRDRRLGRAYQKLRKSPPDDDVQPGSYQDSSEYALPPKQKVVTYCVIDGRVVDQ